MITVALLEALLAAHLRKRPAWWRARARIAWRAELAHLEDALAEQRLVVALQVANG